MFANSSTKINSNENIVFDFLKGILIASLLSLGLVILAAFCLKWFDLPSVFIAPITLAIKGLSVLVGAIFAVKGTHKGLAKGVLFGIIYIIVALVIFSLLAGTFAIGISTLLDVLFAALLGGIVGIVKVNRA